MTMEWRTDLGMVTVSNEVIQRLAGAASIGCTGLVGMASRAQLKDGIAELLGMDNLTRGVVVQNQEGNVTIDLYIIVEYGHQVSSVARQVQDQVFTTLDELTGLSVAAVNVFVQGVRMPEKSRGPLAVAEAE